MIPTSETATSSEKGRPYFNLDLKYRKILFIAAAVICSSSFLSPAFALLLGLLFAQFVEHPYIHLNHKATNFLLQISVVGLGFGMNIMSAMEAGSKGVTFTVVSILGTLLLGLFLGKFLKIGKKISYLISSGTAICGGSAIAAIAPVIKANQKQISVGLGVVFILNSVALFVFPFMGHVFDLSQTQFGLWCAIAIHDTSSVVGAASQYGEKALEVAVTVKLVRALWIIPVTFLSAFLFKNKQEKVSIPWFIGFFVSYGVEHLCSVCSKLQWVCGQYWQSGINLDPVFDWGRIVKTGSMLRRITPICAGHTSLGFYCFRGPMDDTLFHLRARLKRIKTDNQGLEVLAIYSMSCISGYAAHLM